MNKLYKLLVLCLLVIAGGSALKAQTMNVTDGTNTYYADDAISLNEAVTHILEDGSRTFTVNLPSDAETELFTAIRRAIIDTEGVEDGSINLTLAGVKAIPNHDAFDPSNLIFGEYLGDEDIEEYVDQLASVNLPDVISIGEGAFKGCENLVSISAPKVQTIGDWAFAYTVIVELELPEVTSIGWAAFIMCKNLSTVILPKVTNIGQQAFDIKSLTLTSLVLLSEDDIYIEETALGYPESFSANIDLVLNANKKDEVTNGLNWNGFAFKSIMYPCVDGSMNHTYEDVVNNGNETHSFTCTTCGQTKVESCHGGEATCMEHASCDVCGEKYGEFSEHIIDHTTGYCKFGCGEFLAGAKVTSGKTVTYYKTLDELRGNPQNGATITLLREINPEVENYRYEYIEEHNKIITVDLNGNNFNRDGYEIYVSGSEGMLTIVNTAEHRAGIVSAYVTNANKFTVDRNVDIDAILIASNAVDAIIDLSNADFVSSTIKVSGDGFDVSQIILKNHVICDADGNEVTGELAKNVTYNLLAYGIMATVNPMNAGAVTGAGTYNDGEEATLVATPNEGYKFVNWTENDTVVSGEAEFTFVVKGDRNLVANFVTLHEITASVNDENFGAVAGAGVYGYGEEVTLTATPNEGYKFVNWTESDTVVSGEAEYTFVVKGNRNLVANFELLTYEVTVSVNEENFGTVTGSGTYNHGEEVTLTATANEGYKFVNWTENDTIVSEEAEYTFVMKGNRNLVANFELLTYEVTSSVNEENFGTVTGAGVYGYGEEVTLIATPNEGYKFVNWTENDTVVSGEAEYTFVVKGDRNLVANFVSTESIDELTASFRLYPNPVNDKLYIEDLTLTQTLTIEIYDIYGRRQELSAVSCQSSVIEVSNLKSGVYFVKIVTSEGETVKRFVKK